MARDMGWAVKEAQEKNAIHKISVDDSVKKELTDSAKKGAIGLFIASIVVFVVAFGIVAALAAFRGIIIYSVKMIILYIIVIIFPFYAIYNIIKTFGAIKKDEVEFYQGTLVTKTDKGYKVAGLEDHDLSFAKGEDKGINAGDSVNIMKINDDLTLFV